MGKRLKNNLSFKLLALFLALSLWGYVRYTQPTWGQVSSHGQVEVPLTVENVREDLVVLNNPKTITLNVHARPEVLEGAKISDFGAYLDLRGKGEGPYNLRTEVKVPKGIEVEEIPKVLIHLDRIESKKFDVKVRTLGNLPEGKLLSGFDVKPGTVEVTGPESFLDRVKSVEAPVNLSMADYSVILKSILMPVDKEGLVVDRVTISPKYAMVEVKIQASSITMTLPVKPEIIGEVPKGFEVKEVLVYPPVASVVFNTRPVEKINFIMTGRVNIKARKATFSKEVELIPPHGGNILGKKTVIVKTVIKKRKE
ncbi:MAG: hypothetical protein J7M18_04515 [Candidatus Eremiobacteraeota bacterium]|nr:hypothetical protein [Candidatus Eremiobacteraeota bacterium]